MTGPDLPPGPVGLTDEERGDTIGRGHRALVRVIVAVVILGGIAATIVVVNGIPARVSGFVNQVAAGVVGSAATATPTPGATASATTPASTPSPTPTVAPISGDEQLLATMNENESAARPTSTLAPFPIDADAKHQSDLVAANDARWSLIARGLGIDVGSADKVLVLSGLERPWTLADLVANGAVLQLDDTTYVMTKTVFVSRGSTLDLNAPGVTLRLSSGASGYTPLVAWGGGISFAGAAESPLTITSWDTAADAPDTDVTDGRAYVRVYEGKVTTSHTAFSDLGFWSGRTGGFALTGSSIVASTGTIDSTTFSGMHIGLYLDAAEKVAITGTSVRDSREEGIEIGGGVTATTITDTSVVGSATNGIDVRRGSNDVTVTGATLSRNGGYGIRFDGAPRADAANSAGFSVEKLLGAHRVRLDALRQRVRSRLSDRDERGEAFRQQRRPEDGRVPAARLAGRDHRQHGRGEPRQRDRLRRLALLGASRRQHDHGRGAERDRAEQRRRRCGEGGQRRLGLDGALGGARVDRGASARPALGTAADHPDRGHRLRVLSGAAAAQDSRAGGIGHDRGRGGGEGELRGGAGDCSGGRPAVGCADSAGQRPRGDQEGCESGTRDSAEAGCGARTGLGLGIRFRCGRAARAHSRSAGRACEARGVHPPDHAPHPTAGRCSRIRPFGFLYPIDVVGRAVLRPLRLGRGARGRRCARRR